MTQPGDDRLLSSVAELAREEHVQLMSQDLSDAAFAELSEAELQMLASAVAEQLTREPQASRDTAAGRAPRVLAKPSFARRWGWLASAAALLGGGLFAGPWLVQHLQPGGEQVAERAPAASDERRLSLPVRFLPA